MPLKALTDLEAALQIQEQEPHAAPHALRVHSGWGSARTDQQASSHLRAQEAKSKI